MTDFAKILAVGDSTSPAAELFGLDTAPSKQISKPNQKQFTLTEARFSLPRSSIAPALDDTELAIEQLVRDMITRRT